LGGGTRARGDDPRDDRRPVPGHDGARRRPGDGAPPEDGAPVLRVRVDGAVGGGAPGRGAGAVARVRGGARPALPDRRRHPGRGRLLRLRRAGRRPQARRRGGGARAAEARGHPGGHVRAGGDRVRARRAHGLTWTRSGRSSSTRRAAARSATSSRFRRGGTGGTRTGPTWRGTRSASSRSPPARPWRACWTSGVRRESRAGSREPSRGWRGPVARLVGAHPSEVAVMNTLTVNLHLLLASFYRPTPERHRILIEDAAFPSDSHAVQAQAALHGFDPRSAVVRLRPRPGEALLRSED